MHMNKSPSGALCPYYFMGGELHPLHYGSYFNDKERLFEMIKAEEEFILKSSGTNNRRVWIDLYETNLDGETIDFLLNHLKAIRHKIFKLCLIGCSKHEMKKIKEKMKLEKMDLYGQTQYFADPEEGKQWLVNERVITA
ncbi:MAG: hypothetical protein FWG36_05360 [Oscillospiraceae bacterium]|nr:hypothetical protein [Oscillospiraceae bacterium]